MSAEVTLEFSMLTATWEAGSPVTDWTTTLIAVTSNPQSRCDASQEAQNDTLEQIPPFLQQKGIDYVSQTLPWVGGFKPAVNEQT